MSRRVSGSTLRVRNLCPICQINSDVTADVYQNIRCAPIDGPINIEELFVKEKGHCKVHKKIKLLDIEALADAPEYLILSIDRNRIMGVLLQSEIFPLRIAVDMEDKIHQIPDKHSSPFGLFYIGNPCYEESFIGLKASVMLMFNESMILLRFSDKDNIKSRLSSDKWLISEVLSSKPYSTDNTGPKKLVSSILFRGCVLDSDFSSSIFPPQYCRRENGEPYTIRYEITTQIPFRQAKISRVQYVSSQIK